MAECKAQMHLLSTWPEPEICGLSASSQAWLLRRQSRALLSALQRSSPTWVPMPQGGSRRTESRLLQRLAVAKRRLESLQALLTENTCQNQSGTGSMAMRLNEGRPLEGFLQAEVLELSQLVKVLQQDLDCLLQQLKGAPPCAFPRCAAVAHALWTGRLPLPWRRHAQAGPQPPWHWLRQLSRRGQLLVRYLGSGTEVPKRIFHLSAFCYPRRLLLALRWEAAFATATLDHSVPSSNLPGRQGSSSSHLPHKRQELNSNPLYLQVSSRSPFISNSPLSTSLITPRSYPTLPVGDLVSSVTPSSLIPPYKDPLAS